jgi:diadenosine tetraphosphatase ApaH/serine/threonine PP2A family protein phosphatase
MINVGSVGQPRDEDRRSCYVILDDAKQDIEFRRIDYDFETTIQKIYNVPDLDNMLGDRLRSGR